MSDKIIQIVPTDGKWHAKYVGQIEGEIYVEPLPLVCWALVEDGEGYRSVAGVDTDEDGVTSLCENDPNFKGYIHSPTVLGNVKMDALTDENITKVHDED